jgi:radical SAM superfamily enzyme YgiQ (UPF0313 family)
MIATASASPPVRTTRVLFVRLPPFLGFEKHHPRDVTLPLTIAHGATMAKRSGRQVEIVDVWSSARTMHDVLEQIRSSDPQVIFFEADAPPLPIVLRCAEAIRASTDAKLACYGSVPTFLPERVVGEDGPFHAAIHGEAEETMMDLLGAIEEERELETVEGISYWNGSEVRRTKSRAVLQDLDSMPPVDYDLFPLEDYCKYSFPMPLHKRVRWGHVIATRGCPYPCTHCSFDHRQSFGSKFRKHSPERVADEFQALEARGINCISVEDDIFTFDPEYATAVCDELIRRKVDVKWIIQTRVDCYDRTLLRKLKAAGCVGLSLGIESGNDRVLKVLKKGFALKQAIDGVRLAEEEGFMLRLLFIIGNPTETPDEIRDTINYALAAKAITAQVHICTPYPGTKIENEEGDDGRYIEEYSSYNRIVHNSSAATDEELWSLQKEFYRRYYFSWRYLKVFASQRLRYLLGSWRHDLPLFFAGFKYLAWEGRKQQSQDVDGLFEGEEKPERLREVELTPSAPAAEVLGERDRIPVESNR